MPDAVGLMAFDRGHYQFRAALIIEDGVTSRTRITPARRTMLLIGCLHIP